jgi:hypothetical protein
VCRAGVSAVMGIAPTMLASALEISELDLLGGKIR